MGSKVLYPILFVVFACCATATAVGGHSGGQHDNSGAKVSQQNCPSYTYEVDHQVTINTISSFESCLQPKMALKLLPYRDEELYYFKFSSIALNEFPKALRQAFKTMWDNNIGHRPGFQVWDDSPVVRNLFVSAEGGTTRVPTHQSYNEWDCTALFQATIFARSFSIHHQTLSDLYVKPRGVLHGSFHASVESPVGNNAETFALAIDQLRLLRNSLFHSTSAEMDKSTFSQRVQYAKDAFKALGITTDAIDAVGSLTESAFFLTNEVRKLEQGIREESRGYIKFLEDMRSDMEELKVKVEGHIANKDDIAILAQKIDELRAVQETRDAQSKHSDATPLIEKSSFSPMEETPSAADSYHTLGDTQRALGDLSSALKSAQRALEIRRKLYGEDHPSTADSYHSVGDTQRALGDLQSALQSAQRALNIRLKVFGKEHPSTADIYHSLGDTKRALGDLHSALNSGKQALDIRLKLYGDEHPSIADSYHSLGDTQRALGDLPTALQSAQHALKIRRKLYGEDHPSTADSYHSLGDTQRAVGDLHSALQSAQHALKIRRKLYGEDHPSTADIYHSLGETQRALGDLRSARESHQRAQSIRNKFKKS